MVGAPDMVKTINAAWIAPVVSELTSMLGENFDPLTSWAGKPELIASASPQQSRQKWWSEAIGRKAMAALLDAVPPRDQARLLEQANGVGYAFMSVPPSAALGMAVPSDEYKLGLKWWLGLPLMAGEHYVCPGCMAAVDVFGDHLLCCVRNNFQRRHDAVQQALANTLSSAGIPHAVEVVVPGTAPEALRPADLLLRNWDGGRDTAIDLTISHGWQANERGAATTTSTMQTRERWRGFLLRKERAKHQKYDAACATAQWNFVPMALGTWGGLGPEAAKTMARIVKRHASWEEGNDRVQAQESAKLAIGLALSRQVWRLLSTKNFIS